MGFRFRKSFRIVPGIRLNLSKSGISTSVGRRGLTFNLGKRGVRSTVGIPGTGISYSTLSSSGSRRRRTPRPVAASASSPGDALTSVAAVISLIVTVLLGKILPSMAWWAYVLLFLFTGAAIAALIQSVTLKDRSPEESADEQPMDSLPSPQRLVSAQGGMQAAGSSAGASYSSGHGAADARPYGESVPREMSAVRIAGIGAAIMLALVLLPLMAWWVYLFVAPLTAIGLIWLMGRPNVEPTDAHGNASSSEPIINSEPASAATSISEAISNTAVPKDGRPSAAEVPFESSDESFWDADEPKALSRDLKFDYTDSRGNHTSRVVSMTAFDVGAGMFTGYCHLRQERRTFRFNRVSRCINRETGELIDDLAAYCESQYAKTPSGSLDLAVSGNLDAVKVLLYFCKLDGRFTKKERSVLHDVLREFAGNDSITAELANTALDGVDLPSIHAFRLAVGRLATADVDCRARIIDACGRLGRTEKKLSDSEASTIRYIGERFGMEVPDDHG